ncbi:hypothetical protein GMOD_00001898 [Pyrenophora seminiperda CCB06]|uniref:Uncharacterized protein n=1 Tax=Pyrenophora seminiperda CCB06 TaxID=1302712 RepID=A0A3M7LWD0_9PLEO|nr:hypothetical protein GMOD_00001898 [Pyrenophora seminiperda CCB06]
MWSLMLTDCSATKLVLVLGLILIQKNFSSYILFKHKILDNEYLVQNMQDEALETSRSELPMSSLK